MNDPFAGWTASPEHPRLVEDEVHVWGWRLAGDARKLARFAATLADDELRRMRAFRFLADAQNFAWARGGLRSILGRYVGTSPEAIRFQYGQYGKPLLDDQLSGIHFNLSHTKTIAVAAFSAAGPLGIDVEERQPVSNGLAEHVLSQRELQTLNLLKNEAYEQGFFNAWTRKEAICKAEGLGFRIPPQAFSVSLSPGEPARVDDTGGVLSRTWSLTELPMDGTTIGCVATPVPCALKFNRHAL